MNEHSGLLFATPSFLEGVARSLDLGDTLTEYNSSESGQTADHRALHSDWAAVGDDLRQAMEQYRRDHSQERADG